MTETGPGADVPRASGDRLLVMKSSGAAQCRCLSWGQAGTLRTRRPQASNAWLRTLANTETLGGHEMHASNGTIATPSGPKTPG
jgi:hypothetical protein